MKYDKCQSKERNIQDTIRTESIGIDIEQGTGIYPFKVNRSEERRVGKECASMCLSFIFFFSLSDIP